MNVIHELMKVNLMLNIVINWTIEWFDYDDEWVKFISKMVEQDELK